MLPSISTLSSVVDALPEEVFQRVMSRIDISGIIAICQNSDKAAHLCMNDKKIWSGKTLKISTKRQLQSLKCHSHLIQNVRMLDLGDGDITEDDFDYLISTFRELRAVKVTNLAFDFDDQHLETLVKRHGKHLKCLILDRSYLLTNLCAKLIADYCPKLRHLSLFGCMISDAAISLLASSENLCKNLRHLDVGRCHLLNLGKIRTELSSFKKLHFLSMAHNDSCYTQGLEEVIKGNQRLKALDVSGCIELTRKDIKELGIREDLKIMNTACIDDHSFDSIRSFLVSLTY